MSMANGNMNFSRFRTILVMASPAIHRGIVANSLEYSRLLRVWVQQIIHYDQEVSFPSCDLRTRQHTRRH